MTEINSYFHDPRFKMTHAGRLFVRLVFYSTYGILITACITFLLSDIAWLFWSGVLLLLFLLDRVKYFGQAGRSLHRDKPIGKVNLARINP